MRGAAIILACLALAACATPESKLAAGLERAGLGHRVSACMAKRMVHRLSLTQLLRLRSLGSLGDGPVRDLSTREFLHKVRALKDPDILRVTSSSLAVCGLGL